MDSMLGYRSKPVGWASARLDDAVMWLPARISALLIAVAAGVPTAVAGARRWRSAVPSPNAGWPMGALAAALDVRLEKQDVYTLNAEAAFPSEADAARGVRVIAVAGLLAHLLAAWLASLGAGVVAWS
jgi:adenosylcobinamide-phosphate synthase